MYKEIGKRLIKRIERLEAFEERMQIRLENFTIKVDEEKWVRILFEVYPIDGTTIDSNMNIECILYDKENSILEKDYTYITSEDFFGFEVVELNFQEDGIADEIDKIRIYPKK